MNDQRTVIALTRISPIEGGSDILRGQPWTASRPAPIWAMLEQRGIVAAADTDAARQAQADYAAGNPDAADVIQQQLIAAAAQQVGLID